jgi:hypothetical protein
MSIFGCKAQVMKERIAPCGINLLIYLNSCEYDADKTSALAEMASQNPGLAESRQAG